MIFSNETKEIYWILSKLLINYDISIIKKIISIKRDLEDEDIKTWYIEQGVSLNKLRISDHRELLIKQILFDPYDETYGMLRLIHIKIFHLRILFEPFALKGFILNGSSDNKYTIPSLREITETLNYFVDKYGVYEVHGRIFQYTINNLTDIVGNKCIRSIIRKEKDNQIIYEYKTIARVGDEFREPVERMAMLM